MLVLILAASVGQYRWHQRKKEALKERARIATSMGINPFDQFVLSPEAQAKMTRSVPLDTPDPAQAAKGTKVRPTTHLNDTGNHLDEKLKLYEDTTNNILN